MSVGAGGGGAEGKGGDVSGRCVAILQEAQATLKLFRVIEDAGLDDGR